MCGILIKFYPVDPETESFSLSNGQDVFVETLANTHKCYLLQPLSLAINPCPYESQNIGADTATRWKGMIAG